MQKKLKLGERQLKRARKLADLFTVDEKKGSEALTEGQLEIFYAICFRPWNRINIVSCTQYGKSLTVALACIVITCLQRKRVAVLAPTNPKTKLIMRYYLEHLGDSPLFYKELEANTKLERLRQEESKDRIILRNNGGIYTVSAQAGNSKKGIESAMGEGADIVIIDEACLIPDEIEATIFRMISGKGILACYIKIGNPFYSNPPYEHFYKSTYNPFYLQIFIDYQQALREGRYTQEFIDEAIGKPMFDVLYECKFPLPNEIDEKGYRRLLTLPQIRKAMVKVIPDFIYGRFRLGADIGRGGNYNAYVGRDDKYMWLHGKNKSNDTMTNVREIKDAEADVSFIDDTGVGGGVTDRCVELSIPVVAVGLGESASDKNRWSNLRSELFFNFRQWILQGGKLEEAEHWLVLYEIKWKVDSGSRFKVEPKDDMMKRARAQLTRLGSTSPDVIDAGSLTFAEEKRPTVEVFGDDDEDEDIDDI